MWRDFVENGLELVADNSRRAPFYYVNSARILGGHTRYYARPVHTERRKRFQVRLNSRAATAIGARDRQCDGNGFPFRHNDTVMVCRNSRNVYALIRASFSSF